MKANSVADRHIPSRSGTFAQESFDINSSNIENSNTSENTDYVNLLKEANSDSKSSRVLAFKNKAPAPSDGFQNSLKVLYSAKTNTSQKDVFKGGRHINTAPVRILDAPNMLDDYYLNLLSWSATNNLAVALSQSVYLWDATTCSIQELMNVEEDPDDYISSVAWIQQGGSHIAIGTASKQVQLWDVEAGRQIRTLTGHSSRVGALAWNGHMLASGSRDNTILNHDVRIQNHVIGKMTQHTQEVCGLSWSPDGTYLASGANDNNLCIMDTTSMIGNMNCQPRHTLSEHQAAVKALAWSPHERNLLASGGGTADRSIKFWNAQSGSLLNSIDTGSQVCALQWSPMEKELLSSHGFAENQLCLWKYPTMAKIKEFKGHTSRVLHMAQSPDGSMICSGAADETLRFWNIFGAEGKKKDVGIPSANAGLNNSTSLRIR